LEELVEMNIPEIHPTLTKTHKGIVIDWVFTYVPMTDVPFYNADVYHDEEWNNDGSETEMNIEEVRAFWKSLVGNGFNRK